MAKPKERLGKLRTVEVKVEGDDGQPRRLTGVNLDDVLREIVEQLKKDYEWAGDAVASRRLGVPQTTLSLLMRGGGTRLLTLSKICAAVQKRPIDLLRMHPRYRPPPEEQAPFVADAIYDRFRSQLTTDQARRVTRIFDALIDRGALAKTLDAWEAALDLTPERAEVSRSTETPRDRARK